MLTIGMAKKDDPFAGLPRRPMFGPVRAKAEPMLLKRHLPPEVDKVLEPDRYGIVVGVRLSTDLLAKLDKIRGGETRPEALRRLLALA